MSPISEERSLNVNRLLALDFRGQITNLQPGQCATCTEYTFFAPMRQHAA